jgi:argininosuccinate synthase
MKQKVVLAFSGGLDTSFCVPYLINKRNLEVHTVIVNTGGFSDQELKGIEERSKILGALSHTTIDAVNDYYEKGIRYLIFGNILKNNTYPLSVSSERFFQALSVLEHVKKSVPNMLPTEVPVPGMIRYASTWFLKCWLPM